MPGLMKRSNSLAILKTKYTTMMLATIAAKMFYMTCDLLHKGLEFDEDEKEIRRRLKKNIDYVLRFIMIML